MCWNWKLFSIFFRNPFAHPFSLTKENWLMRDWKALEITMKPFSTISLRILVTLMLLQYLQYAPIRILYVEVLGFNPIYCISCKSSISWLLIPALEKPLIRTFNLVNANTRNKSPFHHLNMHPYKLEQSDIKWVWSNQQYLPSLS